MLIPITTRRALRLSGQSPIHAAADGGYVRCTELLVDRGFDVNALLDPHVSEKYGDMRKTALYFAASNGDVTGTQLLLNAGAKMDLDPLHCLLVAVRAGRYEIVRILLSSQADVNCYFIEVNDTVFPTALQYCLRDEMMMRLLLNSGYDAEKCFCCPHDSTWGHSSEHTSEKVPVSSPIMSIPKPSKLPIYAHSRHLFHNVYLNEVIKLTQDGKQNKRNVFVGLGVYSFNT